MRKRINEFCLLGTWKDPKSHKKANISNQDDPECLFSALFMQLPHFFNLVFCFLFCFPRVPFVLGVWRLFGLVLKTTSGRMSSQNSLINVLFVAASSYLTFCFVENSRNFWLRSGSWRRVPSKGEAGEMSERRETGGRIRGKVRIQRANGIVAGPDGTTRKSANPAGPGWAGTGKATQINRISCWFAALTMQSA